MIERKEYPAGVPCWVDVVQPDADATMAFYGGLFGWEFEVRTPPGAANSYAYARKDGLLVAGVGGDPSGAGSPSGWTSYVRVESVDETATAVVASGGRVVAEPVDVPQAGRVAVCGDPSGAVFGLWQPSGNLGAELVNAPGSWNFSVLSTSAAADVEKFYGAVFGWECDPFEMSDGDKASIWRLPGYGEFLAARDPELRERQETAQAPDGFADAVALLGPAAVDATADAAGRWDVIFAVADADAAYSRAVDLGATVVTPLFDTMYTRMGTVSDPQGGVLTLSEYRPPEPS